MTVLFNWRWGDGQTLPAWWTVTRTKIYATLNQKDVLSKKKKTCEHRPLEWDGTLSDVWEKVALNTSRAVPFYFSLEIYNYDALLANVVSKARKFVLWTDFWLWIWKGDVPAVLFQIHPCSKCSVPTPRCSFEFMRVKMLPLHLLPEAIFRIHPCSNPPSLPWETVTQC